jgi:predicted ThiF/HesA family dinucleotide-utilizing enzyme
LINRPRLYFRALIMLAQVQDGGSSKLSDLDRQRIRAEALLRLEQL